MKKVLIYPKYSNNPYQSLLYLDIKNTNNFKIKYLIDGSDFIDRYPLRWVVPIKIILNRIYGFNVIHFHWVEFGKLPQNYLTQFFALLYSISIIIFIKVLRYKLVWTIHDIVPHEKLTANDLLLTKIMCIMSNEKIVHSRSIITELSLWKCNIKNITLIPHGTYETYYKNIISRIDARKFLKIKMNGFIFLFFGELKTYKGVDDLLYAFDQISKTNTHVKLVVAGRVHEPYLLDIIHQYRLKLKEKLQLHTEYIKDDEIQYYFNAADIIVYPFKEITTSGSLLLALAYGKPIIYPQIGGLNDLPLLIGLSYNRLEKNSLVITLKKALALDNKKLKKMGDNANMYVRSLPSWKKIAEHTKAIYEK